MTHQGKTFLKTLDIHCDELMKSRRQFAKPCLDWTAREWHLSGSLGKALLDYLIDNRLLMRSKKKPRVLLLTTKGKFWLQKTLQL